ncbi:hypothetical protein JNUCC6_21145 [Viridibacillus arvi]|nr:hypothetical protein JNUCC6_21145 [Viridibacillus sp. JNUCC-6]
MIHFHHAPLQKQYVEVSTIEKKVALFKVYAGMEADLLLSAIDSGYNGVVLEGLGQGNVPPAVVTGIQALLDHQIPVVLVSRCFNGIAQGVYGYEGGGKMLEDMGVIYAPGISGQKARLKLLIGLNQVHSPIEVAHFF